MSADGHKRIPGATYRLQFNRQFTFNQASRICEYLRDLGVTDCYASPLFRAGPKSTHGYDICDFNELNPHLGGAEGFEAFWQSRRSAGLGLLLDMVPNHMGNDLSNAQWSDILEHGKSSRFACWFDINWTPIQPELADKVLLPVLEDHYGKVLEEGKLRLQVRPDGMGFALAYHDRLFPISPKSCGVVLRKASEVSGDLSPDRRDTLRRLADQFAGNCQSGATGCHGLKLELSTMLSEFTSVRTAVEEALAQLNGDPGKPWTFDALNELLQQQHYRLVYWGVGPEEINYRRFFEVTELASLRMEDPVVVKATHELVFGLLREGKLTGLRIDHPDGLRNPSAYFERLQAHSPVYVVVEKILTGEEQLPEDWPVDGTTGYDYLNRMNGVFVDRGSCGKLGYFYREFTRCTDDFSTVAYEGKRWMLRNSLISETAALVHRLRSICAQTRRGYDFSQRALRSAVIEVIAAFPVYRTYITETTVQPTEAEAGYIREAIARARKSPYKVDGAILDFIEALLLLELPGAGSPLNPACREFVIRFQQLSGPVMAKGLEDTAFYQFHRLVSLNEVGGEPGEFGCSVEDFHRFNEEQARRWPHSLLASATHDTKRGEDVRARINVISEVPENWREAVLAWSATNARHKTKLEAGLAPDANDEYLFYQVLTGCWTNQQQPPDDHDGLVSRLSAYMLKAVKEAKRHATWTEPNPEYEQATTRFVQNVLSDQSRAFFDSFQSVQKQIAFFGVFNSLSQTLLKLTSPGVPDIYQGTELWDLSLVDPDNRRPVDYELRHELLKELVSRFKDTTEVRPGLGELLASTESGKLKLYAIWKTLQLRNERRDIFDAGDYLPLASSGDCSEHVLAYARRSASSSIIVVVPRLPFRLMAGRELPPIGPDVWRGTRVQTTGTPARYRNVMTNEILTIGDGRNGLLVGEALGSFPVALLATE